MFGITQDGHGRLTHFWWFYTKNIRSRQGQDESYFLITIEENVLTFHKFSNVGPEEKWNAKEIYYPSWNYTWHHHHHHHVLDVSHFSRCGGSLGWDRCCVKFPLIFVLYNYYYCKTKPSDTWAEKPHIRVTNFGFLAGVGFWWRGLNQWLTHIWGFKDQTFSFNVM